MTSLRPLSSLKVELSDPVFYLPFPTKSPHPATRRSLTATAQNGLSGQNPQTMTLGSENRRAVGRSRGAGGETEVQSRVLQRQRGRRRGGASSVPSRLAPEPPPPAPHAGSPRLDFALAAPPAREPVMVAAVVAAWLLLSAAVCAQREQDFYDFKAVNIRGKLVSLEKYRGSVSVRPRGLGAAPTGPGARAPRPATVRVWLRGGSAAVPWLPPSQAFPTGCGAPRSCAGSVPRRRGRAPARSETRNSPSRRRFPSQRLWALESGPLAEAARLGPAFVMHGSERNPSILPPLSLPPPVSASGSWDCC